MPQKAVQQQASGDVEVNMEYVQNKVKRQWKNKQSAQHAKRNKNKDKG